MTRNVPLFALTAAAFVSGLAGVATAATTPQAHPTAKATTHMAATHTASTTTRRTMPAATGRMVTAKTSTGKKITYNCSKAGNAGKKACK